MLTDIAHSWLRGHPQAFDDLLSDELDANRLAWLRGNRLPIRPTAEKSVEKYQRRVFSGAEY